MSCPSLLWRIKLEPECLIVRVAFRDLGDSTHCTAEEQMRKCRREQLGKILNLRFLLGEEGRSAWAEKSSDFWYLTSRFVDSAFAYHFTSDGLLKNLLPYKYLFIETNKWLKICYTDHISWRTEVLGRGGKYLFYKTALGTYCSALIITGVFYYLRWCAKNKITWWKLECRKWTLADWYKYEAYMKKGWNGLLGLCHLRKRTDKLQQIQLYQVFLLPYMWWLRTAILKGDVTQIFMQSVWPYDCKRITWHKSEFHPSQEQLEHERRWKPLADENETMSGISLSKPDSKETNFRRDVLLGREDSSESAFQ